MIIRTIRAAMATVVVATSVAVTGPVPASSATTERLLQGWYATHMADDQVMTKAQAVAIADRVDLVTATKRTFVPYMADMKAANPDLRVLVYLNAAFVASGSAYPEHWYAHDAQGQRVRSTKWGNFLMDLSRSKWASEVAALCQQTLADTGYDGCYLDMLGTAPLNPGYTTSLPIDPRTGKVWTDKAYMTATAKIAETVRSVSGRYTAGNGLGPGARYFATDGSSSAPLLDSLDAGHSEVWLRNATDSADKFKNEVSWKRDVDMLVDAGAAGETVLAMTKLWSEATSEQVDRWHRYAVASFLLGTDGRARFTFTDDRSMASAASSHPYDQVDVGTPEGAFAKVDGVYRRSFTKGLALVNPTTSTVTVALGRTYADLAGVTRTSLTMAPNTGEVLTLPVTTYRYTATLDGKQVVPLKGDGDGTGSAGFTFGTANGGRACVEVSMDKVVTPVSGALHAGTAGSVGVAIADFGELASNVRTCVPIDPTLVPDIRQHPERYYVQLTNSRFPGGALRGQVTKQR